MNPHCSSFNAYCVRTSRLQADICRNQHNVGTTCQIYLFSQASIPPQQLPRTTTRVKTITKLTNRLPSIETIKIWDIKMPRPIIVKYRQTRRISFVAIISYSLLDDRSDLNVKLCPLPFVSIDCYLNPGDRPDLNVELCPTSALMALQE